MAVGASNVLLASNDTNPGRWQRRASMWCAAMANLPIIGCAHRSARVCGVELWRPRTSCHVPPRPPSSLGRAWARPVTQTCDPYGPCQSKRKSRGGRRSRGRVRRSGRRRGAAKSALLYHRWWISSGGERAVKRRGGGAQGRRGRCNAMRRLGHHRVGTLD